MFRALANAILALVDELKKDRSQIAGLHLQLDYRAGQLLHRLDTINESTNRLAKALEDLAAPPPQPARAEITLGTRVPE